MKITILTLFPEMFDGPFRESIVKHAQQKGLLEIRFVNIRDFGTGQHKVVDDKPYGGGVGMVLKVDVLDKAISFAKDPKLSHDQQKVILLDARGTTYTQNHAKKYAQKEHLIILCGHYEGVDERVRELVDETISIGDFILTGGEIPAMALVDSIARLIPGVLKPDATINESFSSGLMDYSNQTMALDGSLIAESILLEYPHYTTPQEYKGVKVPDILLSGNHKKIEAWRIEKAQEITKKYRVDLLKKH